MFILDSAPVSRQLVLQPHFYNWNRDDEAVEYDAGGQEMSATVYDPRDKLN